MTRLARPAIVVGLIVTLVPGVVLAADEKCDSGKVKCVGALGAGLLGCHSAAETNGTTLATACTNKAYGKFTQPGKGCVDKLDATLSCSTSGASGFQSLTDAFVVDVVTAVDPVYPTPTTDPCAAGKKKCLAKLVRGLLGCEANYIKKPDFTKVTACRTSNAAKFTTPEKGCFEKVEAKNTCNVSGGAAALLARTQSFVSAVLCINGAVTYPSTIDFVVGAGGGNCGQVAPGPLPPILINPDNVDLTCGGLVLGGGIATTGEHLTPSGTATRFGVDSCSGGVCSVVSVADGGLPVGVTGSKMGSSFGAPIPISLQALPAASACVRAVYASDTSGSLNVCSGAMSVNVSLQVSSWITGNSTEPCPLCGGYSGTPGPGNPKTGTCDRGANVGGPCVTVEPTGLSTDCLPGGADGSVQNPDIPIDLSPLSTGVANKTAADGIFCTGDASHQQTDVGCFAGNQTVCTSITETGSPAGTLVMSAPASLTLSSVFCVPKVGDVLVDSPNDLPGPGALSLSGFVIPNP